MSKSRVINLKIRKLESKDAQQWALMRNALWPDSVEVHLKEIEGYFDGTTPHLITAFTAENEESELVGFIELNIRSYAEGVYQDKVPYVEGWYVDPNYQGHGVGKQLMQQAEIWAKAQGFDVLASDAAPDNHTSLSAHQALGFEETDRIVCLVKRF